MPEVTLTWLTDSGLFPQELRHVVMALLRRESTAIDAWVCRRSG